MTQAWACEKCHSTGTVTLEDGIDVYSVRNAIADDHARIAEWCAERCGLAYVTVPRSDYP